MSRHHQRRRISSLFLLLLILPWLPQPVQAPVTVPISFLSATKTGIVTAASTTVLVTVTINNTIVVDVYIVQTAAQSVSTVSDTQSNTYTSRTVASRGDFGNPLRSEFWTAKALTSGSLTITVTLSASASFGVIVSLFKSVVSIGNTNSRGNFLSPGTGQHVDILSLTIQNENNWAVGGYAGDKLYDCIRPMQGTPTQCFSWSPALPVMTLTQATVDLASTASADMSYGGPFTTGSNDYEMTGKGSLSNTDTTISALELVCCETEPDPTPRPDGGSAGGYYPAEYVTYSIVALLVLAALVFVLAGKKKAALVAIPVIPP